MLLIHSFLSLPVVYRADDELAAVHGPDSPTYVLTLHIQVLPVYHRSIKLEIHQLSCEWCGSHVSGVGLQYESLWCRP